MANEWISVNDSLPEIKEHHCSDDVIVCAEDGIIGDEIIGIDHLEETAFGGLIFACERSTPFGDSEMKVTYWMPLPELPKGE